MCSHGHFEHKPSFLLDRSVLITGEVNRVTGFKKGSPSTRPGAAPAGNPARRSWTIRR